MASKTKTVPPKGLALASPPLMIEQEENNNNYPNQLSKSQIGKDNCVVFTNGSSNEALETTLDAGLDNDQDCLICGCKLCSPRVLSCLHVFCEGCLDNLLIDEAGDSKAGGSLCCPVCQQETLIGAKGAVSLPCDYVLTNILDMTAIESMSVVCTSCKTTESAIARCSDCANFLCPNCNTAHQFMRCFENHKVIAFEDLKHSSETVPIHKPIFCEHHPAENMKFYCYTCLEPICNECLLLEHKAPEHQYERITDAVKRQKEELINLMADCKARITECEQATFQSENTLNELQMQRDQAKDLILETYQSYKALLEKCRDDALQQLMELHSERELEAMDIFHSLDKTGEKIQSACRFTSRLLEHGNAVEILSLHKTVGSQLVNLSKNMPKLKHTFSIEFQTDYELFEKAIKELFGRFRTENNTVGNKSNFTDATTNGISNISNQPIGMGCSSTLNMSGSIPASLQSSFDRSFHGHLPNVQDFTAKDFLSQLGNIAEKSEMSEVSTVASTNPSPTPSLHLANFFNENGVVTMRNLQAMAMCNALASQDVGNISLSNGGLVLGRGTSPGMDNLNTMSPKNMLNGFHSLSSSTSPIQSQRADDLIADTVHGMHGSLISANGMENNNPYMHHRNGNAKSKDMQIRCKFGQLGANKGQFNSPHGFCLGLDEDIIVADTNNHRVQIFDKTGAFKNQFGNPGKEEGQLWYPRKVAVMRNTGKFVVCDRGNERSRMQIFSKNGHFLKKIAIRYIDIVAGLAVTSQGHIVAVDSVSPTVFVLNDNGDLLRWFDCSDYMREPSDIAISGKEYFVCDFKGHCVVVFNEDGKFIRRIGSENITNFPNGIDVSDAGDVLIGDSHGNRFHVAVFSREGSLVSEFECPCVKVSRCCGLKITSEGYVVTLAKNNHHVLILNTLYIS